MSYKKFNDLQNLYEGVVSESNEIDEYTELVYNVIIAEMVYRGHSESVIRTYVENISEEQILEKVESFFSLEEYDLNEEQTDLLFSFYQEQQVLTEGWKNLKLLKNIKNLKNVNVLKNIKGSGAKLKNMIMSIMGKGPGSTKQLKLDLKGAKDGPSLIQKLKGLKKSTGDKLNKVKSKFDRKVTKKSDKLLGPDGKPLKTTKIVNPINKTNALIGGAGLIGGVTALTGGGNKKKDNSSDKITDKDKTDINKENQLNDLLNNKDKLQQLETKPKKKNAAGVEMTGSGTKDDPWISKAVKVKNVKIPMTDPRNPHYYKGIEKGLPNKADWLKKTANSPAAKSGAFTDDQRWAQQLKHREWQDKNNRGAFKVKDNPNTPGNEAKQASKDAAFARRNKRLTDMGLKPVTKKVKTESYDAKGELLGENAVRSAARSVSKVGTKVGKFGKVVKGIDMVKKTTGEVVKNATKKTKEKAPNPSTKASQSAPDAPAKPPQSAEGPKGGESQRTKQSLPKPKKAEMANEENKMPNAEVKASKLPINKDKNFKTGYTSTSLDGPPIQNFGNPKDTTGYYSDSLGRATKLKNRPIKDKKNIKSSYEYDAYDLVLNYIMETEQASSIEEANYIMIEMDQNTIHEIVEEQKKTLIEWKKKAVGAAILAAPWAMGQLEKRWNPVKKARDKYQNKKAKEYEEKSGTTKEDGYFR